MLATVMLVKERVPYGLKKLIETPSTPQTKLSLLVLGGWFAMRDEMEVQVVVVEWETSLYFTCINERYICGCLVILFLDCLIF